jgi:hypothetical protein
MAHLKKKCGITFGIISNMPICSSVRNSFSYTFTPRVGLTFATQLGHPVNKFVPKDVPVEKLCLLGAATDWCAARIAQA